MARNGKKRNIFFLVILIIACILIGRNIYIKFYRNKTLTLQEEAPYEHRVKSKGIIIRDEYVYSESGKMEKIPEGRIQYGVDLQIDEKLGRETNAFQKESIDKRAERLKDQKIETMSEEEILENIQKNIQHKDYLKNSDFIYFFNDLFIRDTEEKLRKETKLKILEQKMENTTGIKSLNTGIVLSEVDHYENILGYNDLNVLSAEDFNLESISLEENNKNKGIKIVNNLNWYLWFKVDQGKLLTDYKKGMSIRVLMDGVELVGQIYRIQKTETHSMMIVEFNTGFDTIKNKRFCEIEIVDYRTNMFRIPTQAIVKQEDQQGVYILSPLGIVEFRPIKILESKGNEVFVESGNHKKLEINHQEVDTVESFHNIILNPQAVTIGELME